MTSVSTSRLRGFTLIELLVVIAIIAILAAILFPVFAQAREKARQTACLSNQKQIGNAMQMYSQDFDEGLPCWKEWVMTSPLGTPSAAGYWQGRLQPYVKSGRTEANDNTGVWQCPSLGAKGELEKNSDGTIPYSYGYNYHVHRSDAGQVLPNVDTKYRYPLLSEMDAPANTVFIGDGGAGGRLRMPYEFAYRKAVKANMVGATAAPPAPAPWEGNEVPDRHNGGANYVFADGHAKWLNANEAFPPIAGTAPTSAETKRAYGASAKYFCYDAAEREWFTKNGTL